MCLPKCFRYCVCNFMFSFCLYKAYLFHSFCLFCLFRVEFMICSNNMVTWETGCKQILLHPLLLCLGRVWVFYCIFQTRYFTMVVTAGWHSPPLWAEFSSLVVTAVITIPASGLRLMSLTCLANIKSIMLSPCRRPGGESGHQLRVDWVNRAHPRSLLNKK